jgi:hypothetical protein
MSRRDFSSRAAGAPPRLSAERVAAAGAALVFVADCAQAWRASAELDYAKTTLAEASASPAVAREPMPAAAPGRTPALLTAVAPPPVVLADIAALAPPDVRLGSVALNYGGPLTVDIAVVARRASDYDLFLERLASSPRFTAVTPGEEDREGELRANIRATYQPAAP